MGSAGAMLHSSRAILHTGNSIPSIPRIRIPTTAFSHNFYSRLHTFESDRTEAYQHSLSHHCPHLRVKQMAGLGYSAPFRQRFVIDVQYKVCGCCFNQIHLRSYGYTVVVY